MPFIEVIPVEAELRQVEVDSYSCKLLLWIYPLGFVRPVLMLSKANMQTWRQFSDKPPEVIDTSEVL